MPKVFCNKCGYYGPPPDTGMSHYRVDGSACPYHAGIARETTEATLPFLGVMDAEHHALRVRIEVLEAALRPFADAAEKLENVDFAPDQTFMLAWCNKFRHITITLEQLRAARAAMKD